MEAQAAVSSEQSEDDGHVVNYILWTFAILGLICVIACGVWVFVYRPRSGRDAAEDQEACVAMNHVDEELGSCSNRSSDKATPKSWTRAGGRSIVEALILITIYNLKKKNN